MLDNYFPFVLFVIAMTCTPGPGNLTMLAIGQATGFRSAVPFLAGMIVGVVVLDTSVAFGLGEAFKHSPASAAVMQWVGTAYICWLGWKVLNMQLVEREVARRFTFVEGLILHPLSPKSWAMAVAAFSQFVNPSQPMGPQLFLFVFTFMCGALLFHSMWCVAGANLLRLLHTRRTRLAVNAAAVTLMIGATVWAMFGTGV